MIKQPGNMQGANGASLPQTGKEGCRKKRRKPRRAGLTGRGKLPRTAAVNYPGLLTTAQAIRAGEPAAPGVATAWITIAVPPLLNTELGSSPSVTFGATTLTWAVPSAAT